MGGQDWPKAISALENVARSNKNRSGPYVCVFGIAIDKGQRQIHRIGKTKQPYSVNTKGMAVRLLLAVLRQLQLSRDRKGGVRGADGTSKQGQQQLVTPDTVLSPVVV